MDKSLLIAIFVPTPEEADGGSRGRLGTGYPVGPNLILTAGHVVKDAAGPIRVRWHYHRSASEADNGWITLPEDAVIWRSGDGLDAALLRCPRPESATGWGIVSEEHPADHRLWASEGFPRAAEHDGARDPCAFGGTCRSKAAEENYFELQVDGSPSTEDDWRGASGMPIFVGRRILGVAQRVPQCFGAERLHATPCWKLLKDPEFRRLLGYDEQRAKLARATRGLVGVLTLPAFSMLADVMGCLVQTAKADSNEGKFALAERLLNSDIRIAIDALVQAHREFDAAGPDARSLVAAACWVIPALFNRGVVTDVSRSLGLAMIPLPAGSFTAAELIMAGVDGRDARFHPRKDVIDEPAGQLCLPITPEQGIGGNVGAAVARHIHRKFDPASCQAFRTRVDQYLIEHYYRPQPGEPERAAAEKIRLASDLLSRHRRHYGETYYMVFIPGDEVERQNLESLLHELKRDYEALAFLVLDFAADRRIDDRDITFPLLQMLPLKPSPTGETAP